jgi:hypothetical protein
MYKLIFDIYIFKINTVEVVSCSEKVKDGRTVRQMLIDTYAEDQKKIEIEKERSNDDAEAKSLKT